MKARGGKIDLKSINANKTELTVEKLRELIHQPDLSDEVAKEIILSIKVLVGIILNSAQSEDQNETDQLKTAA